MMLRPPEAKCSTPQLTRVRLTLAQVNTYMQKPLPFPPLSYASPVLIRKEKNLAEDIHPP